MASTRDAETPDAAPTLVQRVTALRPVRVFQHYSAARGPIIASGLAYSAVFAAFAAIWAVFSILGLVVSGDIGLRRTILLALQSNVPGLVSTASQPDGAIDPEALFAPQNFGIPLVIATVGLLFTALGFLSNAREGIRVVFDLPQVAQSFVAQKLHDIVFGLGFGVALVLSVGMSVAGTAATGFALDLVGIGDDSVVGQIIVRVVTLALTVAVDVAIVGGILRLLSEIAIPWRYLRQAALIGGVGLSVLKILFQLGIVGSTGSNALLGSFAVIIGIFIFFNFVCQVLLISASWAKVGLDDRGIVVDQAVAEARLEAARELVADADTPVRGRFMRLLGFGKKPTP